MKVRRAALVDNSIPSLHCPLQILNRPELPIKGRGLGTEQGSGCVFMQPRPKVFNLCLRQLGSIATFSMILQCRHAALTVLPTPAHQTALAAPSNLSHLLCRVVGAIQSNSQKSAPCWAILALRMRLPQFLDLLFRQLKFSLGHVSIIQYLSVLSIRTVE